MRCIRLAWYCGKCTAAIFFPTEDWNTIIIIVVFFAAHTSVFWGSLLRDGPLEKWWSGVGMWGKNKKQQIKIIQGRVTEKNRAKEKWRKKVPAEWIAPSALLAWRAPWQPLSTAVLISWYWCNTHFTWFSLQLGKRTSFDFKADTFCAQQPHHEHC